MGRRLVVEADGGSRGNPGPAGYGAVVRDADTGEVLDEVAAGIGRATNNVAEYQGLLAGLRAAIALDPESVDVRMDSKLVVEQMNGHWQVKHPDMLALRKEAATVVAQLPRVTFTHIPRAQNSHADRLANEAMDAAALGASWVRPADFADAGASEATATTEPDVVPVPQKKPANRLAGWQAHTTPPTGTVLLRHGQAALSVERRFNGSTDGELTDVGRAQATAAAQRVAAIARRTPISAIYSSPLRRARETAAAAAGELGLEIAIVDDLRETAFGEWEGRTFAEVQKQWPDELAAWLADPSVAPPSGESFDTTMARVLAARDALVASHPGQTVLVVSHVTPIKVLLRTALEAPPSALYRLHLDLASVSVVDWYDDGVAVARSVNDAAHLDSVSEPPA
jgi:probable phosphoglycerate mutase